MKIKLVLKGLFMWILCAAVAVIGILWTFYASMTLICGIMSVLNDEKIGYLHMFLGVLELTPIAALMSDSYEPHRVGKVTYWKKK